MVSTTKLKSFLTFYCLFLSKSLSINMCIEGWRKDVMKCGQSLSSFFEYIQYIKCRKSLFEINLFPCNQMLGYI